MRPRCLSLLASALLASAHAGAHHSIAAVYDGSRQMTLTAVVTKFDFIHPHPFITVTVADDESGVWRLEMDNRFELASIGMTAETFKAGDRVVVTGSPGRSDARTLYIRKLERPADGFEYQQVGFNPSIRPGR